MDSDSIRIHTDLINRLNKFIKAYKDKRGIKISMVQATLLLDKKIEKIGGLVP